MKTILIVEDDFSIRDTLKMALENEGYSVIEGRNGREGLEKARQNPKPAAILLDMLMPVMNGEEFLATTTHSADLSSIPVIVITGSVGKSKCAGATAILQKPVDLNLLLTALSNYAV